MKKSFYKITVLGILLIFFTACQTTKSIVEKKPEPDKIVEKKEQVEEKLSYKMIDINETSKHLITEIKYPVFLDFDVLNTYTKGFAEFQWQQFKETADFEWEELSKATENPALPPFYYIVESEVFNSKKYASVLMTSYINNGGAHGNYIIATYTLDKKTKKFVNLLDTCNKTYEEISKICQKQLIETLIHNNPDSINDIISLQQMIEDGTTVNPGNYENFTVDNSGITVYFEPYTVAPYAYGIQKVKIKY